MLFFRTTSRLIRFIRFISSNMLTSLRYNLKLYFIISMSFCADKYRKRRNRISEYPSKEGKVAIVTGGYTGIGLEIVRNLLKCKMKVVIASRNAEKGEQAVNQLRKEGLLGEVSFMQLDLSSLKSVEAFSKEFKSKYDRLDILVNNAGIMYGPHRLTVDGFEMQLATNYLGHFYLTHLLMDHLIKSGNIDRVSRVVNVSSCAHFGAHMFFEDFNMEKSYNKIPGYTRSKMAQILSTRYLNKMFQDHQLPVKMYAVHPGLVATNMLYNTPEMSRMSFMAGLLKTPAQGAVPATFCAISPEMEQRGGAYISNCVTGYTDGYSKNPENMEKLYQVTRKMLGIEEFGKVDYFSVTKM